MKQLTWGLATLATAVGLTAVVQARGTGGATAARVQTIVVDSVALTHHFVEEAPNDGPRSPTPGDVFVGTDKLVAGGRQVGTDQVSYTVTDPPLAQTTATLVLPRGHIVASDRFDFTKKRQRIAITGGTGDFRGARGEVVSDQISGDTSRLTIRLVR